MKKLRPIIFSLVSMVLLACAAESPRSPDSTDAIADVPPSATAVRYRIVPEDTEIVILAYRAGALARLGHNHVIAANEVEGTVFLDAQQGRSSFELRVPVAALKIDEPERRLAEGEEFASQPTPADIEGTGTNMLGPELLDAAQYPVVTVTGTAEGGPDADSVSIRIRIREMESHKVVPMELAVGEGSIAIRGALELTHEELGLTPFSALLGALQVAESIDIRFAITATLD